jgi:hypothetical protein
MAPTIPLFLLALSRYGVRLFQVDLISKGLAVPGVLPLLSTFEAKSNGMTCAQVNSVCFFISCCSSKAILKTSESLGAPKLSWMMGKCTEVSRGMALSQCGRQSRRSRFPFFLDSVVFPLPDRMYQSEHTFYQSSHMTIPLNKSVSILYSAILLILTQF